MADKILWGAWLLLMYGCGIAVSILAGEVLHPIVGLASGVLMTVMFAAGIISELED